MRSSSWIPANGRWCFPTLSELRKAETAFQHPHLLIAGASFKAGLLGPIHPALASIVGSTGTSVPAPLAYIFWHGGNRGTRCILKSWRVMQHRLIELAAKAYRYRILGTVGKFIEAAARLMIPSLFNKTPLSPLSVRVASLSAIRSIVRPIRFRNDRGQCP